jgi:hypothetical protein
MPDFQDFQRAFTAHIRDPKRNPRPVGVPARRMQVYNELLLNNLEGFLLACFPVLRQVLGKRNWNRLVRDFFSEHTCQSPIFRQIPEEFVQYLQQERQAHENDPPWLPHLAHYEWIELALSVSPLDMRDIHANPEGDLMTGHPCLNPVHAVCHYPYAVHRIGPKNKIATPLTTTILAHRDHEDVVRFIEINPITARLVELLEPGKLTGAAALEQIATELQHSRPETVIQGGITILDQLRAAQVILGTTK